jgi:hypothetical protein
MGKLKTGTALVCGHTGLLKSKSLCNNCYQKHKHENKPKASCHPERKSHCRGLCSECYRKEGPSKRANCHPERLHRANGLCRECYQSLPENKEKAVKVRRLAKYGLTDSKYIEIMSTQGWACAICGGEPTAVDHDHKTGLVRGILCRQCNTGIGHLRDDVSLLESAILYLKGSKNE